MKPWLILLIATLALSACGKKSDANDRDLRSTTCEEDYRCTMEYQPYACSAKGLTASGGNKCHAAAELKLLACKKGVSFQTSEMTCSPEN